MLTIEEHLNKVRPCLKDIINDLKKNHKQIIQFLLAINFMSFKVSGEERLMGLKHQ